MAVVRRTISLPPHLDRMVGELSLQRRASYSAVVAELLESALGLDREPAALPYFGLLADEDPELGSRVEEILYGKP